MKVAEEKLIIADANSKAGQKARKTVGARKEDKGDKRHQPDQLQIAADGRKRAVLNIQLPANAIVDQFDLTLTAKRAELVKAQDVADLRSADDRPSPSMIVDFGALRTVNAVLLPTQHRNHKIFPWLGTKFDDRGILLTDPGAGTVSRGKGESRYTLHYFSIAEIRTERVRIELGNEDAQLESVMQVLELSLPELPADLSLRINGGAPVWEHGGTVQLSSSSELDQNGWTEKGQRLLSIAAALQAFVGVATSSALVDFTIEMTSNVPGRLAIAVGSKSIRLLHRLRFDDRDELKLEFDGEGQQQLLLSTPQGVNTEISGVSFALKGEFPLERVLPPLGPDPNQVSELLLGDGRAACVRLDGGEGLAELTAVRFPLENKSSGAEARVVLWRDQGGLPVEALSEAVSEPVSWNGNDEQWITFAFSDPVAFDPAAPVWAALIVNRGEVIWKMATANASGDNPIRLGAQEGPWRALPAVFGTGTTLGSVAGRVHVAGLADESKPLAALLIALDDIAAEQAVTPDKTTKLIQMEIPSAEIQQELPPQEIEQVAGIAEQAIVLEEQNKTALTGRTLTVVSRSAGSITLSKIDVITADDQGGL